jgi:hypothetical protein
MAILDDDGKIYILRWSEIGRPPSDADDDGIPDAWESAQLGGLGSDPEADDDGDRLPNAIEYLFGTSPAAPSGNPLKSSVAGSSGAPVLLLEFPRRSGLAGSYQIQISPDLMLWTAASGVVETVVGSHESPDGVPIETVRAEIPGHTGSCFARIKWISP